MKVKDTTGVMRRGDLRFEARVGGRWKRVTRAGRQRVVKRVIPARAVRKVLVRVRMSPTAGNDTMNLREPFRITVRLTSVKGR